MTHDEREAMEREAARIQAFKGRVKMYRCECGHELETDFEPGLVLTLPCSHCMTTGKWTEKRGKAIANDPTAPLEMKKKSKKGADEEA